VAGTAVTSTMPGVAAAARRTPATWAVSVRIGGAAGPGREMRVEQLLAGDGLDGAAEGAGLRQAEAGVAQAEGAEDEQQRGEDPHSAGVAAQHRREPCPQSRRRC